MNVERDAGIKAVYDDSSDKHIMNAAQIFVLRFMPSTINEIFNWKVVQSGRHAGMKNVGI